MKHLFINFKTTCASDFTRGVHHYVNDPTFEILLCTYYISDDSGCVKYSDIISEQNLDNLPVDEYYVFGYGISFIKLVFENKFKHVLPMIETFYDIKDIAAKLYGQQSLGLMAKKLNIKSGIEKSIFFCFNGPNREDYKTISLKNKQNLIHNAKIDLYTAVQILNKSLLFSRSFEWLIILNTQKMNERGIDIDMELLTKGIILINYYKKKGSDTSKLSWLKFLAFKNYEYNGKIYNYINYHGTISGRFTSSDIAIHSLQKSEPTFFNDDIKSIKELNVNYEDIPTVLGRSVRGLIIPPPGHLLYIGDFKQIEPRIMAWLVDDPILPKLASGMPIYENMASKIFNKEISELSENEIKIGKITLLSASYGISSNELAKTYKIPNDLAVKCIDTFRSMHPKIFEMAYAIESFMKYAIQHSRDQEKSFGLILIKKQKDDFIIQDPCGEFFVYKNCALIKSGCETLMQNGSQLYAMKIFAHICQFIGRNILCNAVNNLKRHNLDVLFTVHDEIVTSHYELPEEKFKFWLEDCCNKNFIGESHYNQIPLEAKVKITNRYC